MTHTLRFGYFILKGAYYDDGLSIFRPCVSFKTLYYPRDIKNSSDPSVIPFSAGNPAPEAFPAKEIAEISQTILSETPIAALQYSITEGYTPLRETISSYMKSHHQIGREFDDIIVTSGAQQVMNLASKVLCNEEDVIICEAPSFIGSLNTFRSIKTRLRGISMEEDGMNMLELEQALKKKNQTHV